MAFIDQTNTVAQMHGLGRKYCFDTNNYEAFLEETFDIVKINPVGLVRADSGFYSDSFLSWFETKKPKLCNSRQVL